jgi:hypothetical protein
MQNLETYLHKNGFSSAKESVHSIHFLTNYFYSKVSKTTHLNPRLEDHPLLVACNYLPVEFALYGKIGWLTHLLPVQCISFMLNCTFSSSDMKGVKLCSFTN